MNVSLMGINCLQNSFDGIFISSDKVEFKSGAAQFTAVTVETARSTVLSAPPTDRESDCIFNNNKLSPATCSSCCSIFLFVFCSNSLGVSIYFFLLLFGGGGGILFSKDDLN